MSSLDGMGRYYPLTVFACANPDDVIAPPDIDAHDEWFVGAEDFLLSTLDKEVTFEAITSALDQLAAPTHQPTGSPPEGMSILADGVVASSLGNRSFSELFTLLRTANDSSIYAAASFWWTVGGGDYQPFGFCCQASASSVSFHEHADRPYRLRHQITVPGIGHGRGADPV